MPPFQATGSPGQPRLRADDLNPWLLSFSSPQDHWNNGRVPAHRPTERFQEPVVLQRTYGREDAENVPSSSCFYGALRHRHTHHSNSGRSTSSGRQRETPDFCPTLNGVGCVCHANDPGPRLRCRACRSGNTVEIVSDASSTRRRVHSFPKQTR